MIYLDIWKRCFDYKGKSSRKEFWIPFAVHAGLSVLAGILIGLSFPCFLNDNSGAGLTLCIFAGVILLYLVAGILPFISLTVRRLHDSGRSGWWYFLIFGFGVGAILLLFLLCSSSVAVGFNRSINEPVCVYGPPPTYYDPDTEEPVEIYGPPEDFDSDTDTEVETIYGPPEDFDTEENMPQLVYGPPEDFDDTEE